MKYKYCHAKCDLPLNNSVIDFLNRLPCNYHILLHLLNVLYSLIGFASAMAVIGITPFEHVLLEIQAMEVT